MFTETVAQFRWNTVFVFTVRPCHAIEVESFTVNESFPIVFSFKKPNNLSFAAMAFAILLFLFCIWQKATLIHNNV